MAILVAQRSGIVAGLLILFVIFAIASAIDFLYGGFDNLPVDGSLI